MAVRVEAVFLPGCTCAGTLLQDVHVRALRSTTVSHSVLALMTVPTRRDPDGTGCIQDSRLGAQPAPSCPFQLGWKNALA